MMFTRRRRQGDHRAGRGLDTGKAELMCCVWVPDEGHQGKRLQEVAAYPTMTPALHGMSDHLACPGVTRVVVEATADYWKPVFYLLEAAGVQTWLGNANAMSARRPLRDRPALDPEAGLSD